MGTDPPALVTLGQHDDDVRLLLQNHLPEIVPGLGQRALRGDVLVRRVIPLQTGRGSHTHLLLQPDTDTEPTMDSREYSLR